MAWGVEHKIAPVDETVVATRLFCEFNDLLAVQAQGAEAAGRGDGGQGRCLAMSLVIADQGVVMSMSPTPSP